MPIAHINNTNIYYKIHGDISAPPLVMIMGLGMNTNSWAPLLSYFSRVYCCIVFDNRGSGQSSLSEKTFSIETLADDTALLIDMLGLEKVHILGLSMGGLIAIEFALKYQDRLNSLILISSGPKLSKRVTIAYQMSLALRQAGQNELAVEQDLLWVMDERFFENEKQLRRFKRIWRRVYSSVSLAGYEAQLRACLNFDALSRLHQIQVPTLIARGKGDITASHSCLQQLADNIPNVTYQLYDGGHLFFLNKKSCAMFAATSMAFLANIEKLSLDRFFDPPRMAAHSTRYPPI